ncbi:REP element-mobilizing transposase RayT [Elizabethkingia anophelis]|nr:REP element-mobilizing transposase RayT [Elizabethkingia anophelis]MCW2466277.1 REP element-mobilizing transposase RayT [Elizabethkingia anophelis]MCW2469961.1 REP element-mobilizing transposase RayT [Elizabethkingia anophelis]
MSSKYKATEITQTYFITMTTVGWIDIFTRLNQKYIIINALKYCQENKGLTIFAYCLMHSHLHLLCRADAPASASLRLVTNKTLIKLPFQAACFIYCIFTIVQIIYL